MKEAIKSLKRILKRPILASRLTDNPTELDNLGSTIISSKRHFDMMLYTYVFATFAIGQRSLGYICDIAQVYIRLDFTWVKEKQNEEIGMSAPRGIYYAPEVCQQLEFYEN